MARLARRRDLQGGERTAKLAFPGEEAMPKAYFIVRVDISDPAAYGEHTQA